MKRTFILLLSLLALTASAGCSSLMPAQQQEAAERKPVASQVAYGSGDCNAQADSRLKLFDRPDTYPMSNQEISNAREALYDECMRAHAPQVAGIPRSDTQANAQDVSRLAALSPAAGGNPPQNSVAGAYPGSTVIMVQGNDVSQLAGLSPAAGGNPSSYPGATVVVVQAPAAVVPPIRPPVEMPAALARPVAPPVQPQAATVQTPARPATAPTQPQTATQTLAAPAPAAPKTLPVASGDQDTQQLEQILTK